MNMRMLMVWLAAAALGPFGLGAEALAQATLKATGAVVVRYTQDGKDVEVLIEGEKIEVLCDGEKVPRERLTLTAKEITIQGNEGVSLGTVDLAPDPSRFRPANKGVMKIGVNLHEVDGALAAQLGLAPEKSLLVVDVEEDLPAKKAGVEKFDIITRINEETEVTREALRRELSLAVPGKPLSVDLLRGGETLSVEIRPELVRQPRVELKVSPVLVASTGRLVLSTDLSVDDVLVDTVFRDRLLVQTPGGVRVVGETAASDPSGADGPVARLEKEIAAVKKQLDRMEQIVQELRKKDS